MMNMVLQPVLGKFALVYIDDILIYSRTEEEHKEHIRIVLQLLRANRLFVKLAKSLFGRQSLPFLGHIVGIDGIRVDPQKTAAVTRWPRLISVDDVSRFLGFSNFVKKFMKGFSQQVSPMYGLTKKGTPWMWSKACEEAFCWVKTSLQNAPVLAYPDTQEPFCAARRCQRLRHGRCVVSRRPPCCI